MKILQINTVCKTGSVGRIMTELYEVIEKSQNAALLAYGRGKANGYTDAYKIGNIFDFGFHVLQNFFCGESGFGSRHQTEKFLQYIEAQKPDIIHLHNIHGFYLQIELLFAYIKKHDIPVVWTLHDCWAFTGHCAYFDYADCNNWKTGCAACAWHRSTYPYALFKDNARQSFLRKKAAFTDVKHLTIVTPSEWLKNLVKQSFLNEYEVNVIANGIDTNVFAPVKQRAATDKKIILGVANIWEKRKGMQYFEALADILDQTYQIVLVGVSKKQKQKLLQKYTNGSVIPIMRTNNVQELARLYGQAFVYVNTTLEDNFPTTNIEALACGTPVITFATGGSMEAIDDTCGITIKQKNAGAIASAIKQIEETPFTKEACRKRALRYKKEARFADYVALYENILYTIRGKSL